LLSSLPLTLKLWRFVISPFKNALRFWWKQKPL
jgi:hypothetical protein